MALSTFWWLLAGAAVVAELLTGTVYLLLIGAGFAAAALGAHLGVALAFQMLVAAAVGVGLVAVWHRFGRHRRAVAIDKGLDIGETVQVEQWNADGTASVHYRGAVWAAIAAPRTTLSAGAHRVASIVGNRLVLEPV